MLLRGHSCVARVRLDYGFGAEAFEARFCGTLWFYSEKK